MEAMDPTETLSNVLARLERIERILARFENLLARFEPLLKRYEQASQANGMLATRRALLGKEKTR